MRKQTPYEKFINRIRAWPHDPIKKRTNFARVYVPRYKSRINPSESKPPSRNGCFRYPRLVIFYYILPVIAKLFYLPSETDATWYSGAREPWTEFITIIMDEGGPRFYVSLLTCNKYDLNAIHDRYTLKVVSFITHIAFTVIHSRNHCTLFYRNKYGIRK